MRQAIIRPGVLNRIKESRGIQTDEAMAKIGKVSKATYLRYRDGKNSPDWRFVAEICTTFGYSIGELVQLQDQQLTEQAAA